MKLHNLLTCLWAKAGYQRFVTAYCLLYYCLLTHPLSIFIKKTAQLPLNVEPFYF